MTRFMRSVFVAAVGAGTVGAGALASTSTFQTGRFLSGDAEVRAGLFAQNVTIDTLTVGDATYRVERSELMHAMTVRVYVDTNHDGTFELLGDEAMASGRGPVGFAVARELDASAYGTALSAMQGLSLSHMLYTDGSAHVRVDVLLALGTYDDRPVEDDGAPEVLVIGSFDDHRVTVRAITAGNVDEPVFAADAATLDGSSFRTGRTGMDVLTHRHEAPFPIAIVGLDQSGDLGVEEGIEVLGYRVEVAAGAPAMFNIIGATFEGQGPLGRQQPELDDDAVAFGGALGGGGGRAGGAGRVRTPGLGGGTGFRGSPGGFGGGRGFNFNVGDGDSDSDDDASGSSTSDKKQPDGSQLAGNNFPTPPGTVLHGDNKFDLETAYLPEQPDDPKPPNPPTPVPGPGGIGLLILALSPRRRPRG